MKLTKCEAGHFYDGDKYPECPYCNAELQKDTGIVAAADGRAGGARAATPQGPVTGWLVALNGPARGRDLRLGEGRSFVGQDAAGAPMLLDANTPLAARQTVVVYDPAENSFTLLPGTSAELCYHNGKSVLVPVVLAAGDTVKLGGTELRFVPFCGEFRWAAPAKPAPKPEPKTEPKPAKK